MGNNFDEKSIVNRNKIFEVPEGTVILKEGEINLDMYKIVSGHVEMYTGYGTENEVLIGLIGSGSCFGEFGILTGAPAIYTIITYSKTRLLRITEGLMGDFIQENHEDILKIMRNMATNMTRMQHQINQLSEELAEKNASEEAFARTVSKNVENVIVEYLNSDNLQKDNLKNYVLSPDIILPSNTEAPSKELTNSKGVGMHFLKRGWRK